MNIAVARVFVIAQKEVVRQTVRTILTDAGHEVLEAADASVGLWAYAENPADAVFIDVFAPGKTDAADFVRQLRREDPGAVVIAMAGRPSYGLSDPLAVVRQLGATRTLRMPFSPAELLSALNHSLQ